MDNLLNTPIDETPKPPRYTVGAVVEFVLTGYTTRDINNGILVNLNLRPHEILEWPEDADEPQPDTANSLPIYRHAEFLMNDQVGAVRNLADKLERFTGLEWEGMSILEYLNALRGHAVTMAIIDVTENDGRVDVKGSYRHNS